MPSGKARPIKSILMLLAARLLVVAVVAGIFFSGILDKITYPKSHWDTVEQYAGAFDVDPYLVMAIIKVESNFRPAARSKSGALGLMQVMPDTGRWAAGMLGVAGHYNERLLEPDYNIMIGSWYIDHLLELYQDATLAIAAYNAGRGNVDRWLADGTWSGEHERAADVPFKETGEFIRRVRRAWEAYRDIYAR